MKTPRKIGLPAALAALCLLAVRPADATITLSQAKLGNIFLTTEAIEIPLTCNGNEITWTAKDFFGATVGQGAVIPVGGAATIKPDPATNPNLKKRGYFDLEITEKNNGAVVSQKNTAYAVITPIDITGMANSPFGVMTHFAQTSDLTRSDALQLFARGGFAHMRDEQYWKDVEPQPGQYIFPERFTHYMSVAAGLQINPLIILTFANPFYDYERGERTAPHSDNGRSGYSNYAISVLNQYGSQVKEVEIWNEYNGGNFARFPLTPEFESVDRSWYYFLMLRHATQMMKVVRPGIKVIAVAGVPIPHGFIRELFEEPGFDAEVMPDLHAISVHPYRAYPDAVDLELSELQQMIKTHNGGQEKPIWATEFGAGAGNAQEQYAAATYAAQIVTLMLTQRVERMYYYVGLDGPDLSGFEFWGLLGNQAEPKGKFTPHPPYVAYANAVRQLYGATYQSRFGGTKNSTYAFKFTKSGQTVTVLWSLQPVNVQLTASSNLTVTDIMGQERTVSPVGGMATLAVTTNLQFVRGPVTAVADVGNALVADSLSGYSKTQGQNGWHYGYAALSPTAAYSPSNFQPMTWGIWSNYAYAWLGTGPYHFIGPDQMHPDSEWAIRRWVSNVTGTVTLSGRLTRHGGGDGVNVRIFVEGNEVYSRFVNVNEDVTFSVPNVSISTGNRIDFTLNQNGNNTNDSSRLVAQVTLQQPATQALTVNSGSGSGNYPVGTVVPISANPAPAGQVFSAWTGDTATVANPASATTNLTMPASAVTVTAAYSSGASMDKIRFYPRAGQAGRMVGGVFEGTNDDPHTGPYTVIHTIPTAPPGGTWTEVNVSLGSYRYLRYRSPNGGWGNVAEVEFYRGGIKLNGPLFGTPGSYQNLGNTFDKVFDGNTTTFFDASQGNGAYAGMEGWANADIGAPLPVGSFTQNAGAFTVQGGGGDIWGNTDSFHFVYRPLTGDGSIVAKVESVGNTNAWAKAGVMIRGGLAANAANAFAAITPGNGFTFQRRGVDGGGSGNTSASAQGAPRWVKVTRSGSTFTGFYSADGIIWTPMPPVTCTMPATVYIGLAVTSHAQGTPCTGVFTNVSP